MQTNGGSLRGGDNADVTAGVPGTGSVHQV